MPIVSLTPYSCELNEIDRLSDVSIRDKPRKLPIKLISTFDISCDFYDDTHLDWSLILCKIYSRGLVLPMSRLIRDMLRIEIQLRLEVDEHDEEGVSEDKVKEEKNFSTPLFHLVPSARSRLSRPVE